MEARDFLDQTKRRMTRIVFPAFTMYDTYAGLLDVNFSETMSTSQDITIGEIVVPELTFQTVHADFTPYFEDIVRLDAALEESREDITEDLQTISEAFDSGQLVFAQSVGGFWLVGDGTALYSVWFDGSGTLHHSAAYTAAKSIEAISLCEGVVNTDDDGVLNSTGVIWLVHDEYPYVTRVFFRSADRDAEGIIPGCRFGAENGDRPDVDGDGFVTANDAQIILDAAARIAAGEPSGLTPEQELLADADRDGTITAVDGQLVLSFATAVGAGDYTDDADGWLAFLTQPEQRFDTDSELGMAVILDAARSHASTGTAGIYRSGARTHELLNSLDIRWASRYLNGTLRRYPAYGTAYRYSPASYGRCCMTEFSSRDEETTDVLCSGILLRTVGLNAAGFFTHANFDVSNFAELFRNFCAWLTAQGIPVEPGRYARLYFEMNRLPDADGNYHDHATPQLKLNGRDENGKLAFGGWRVPMYKRGGWAYRADNDPETWETVWIGIDKGTVPDNFRKIIAIAVQFQMMPAEHSGLAFRNFRLEEAE